MTLDQAKCAIFDPETYKILFLEYLMANNLPFAHADSPALATLLAYVRRCETDDLPTINRKTMRAALDKVYQDSVDDLKSKFAKHKGKFGLTLDEWKSGNNFDFLAITLHYHDSDFAMKKYAIGFEVLNKDASYTGEVLYKHLDNVLTEYDIKDRIISITRDNASPINSLVGKFKASLVNDVTGKEFSGDLRCFGHVMNLATTAFLSCVHFKVSKSKVFRDLLDSTKKNFGHREADLKRVETMPHIVNTIIHSTRHNAYVRNIFKGFVKTRNDKKLDKRLPENLLQCNETRWLSVHRMLDRFLLFRPEIMKMLILLKTKSDKLRSNLPLKTCNLVIPWAHKIVADLDSLMARSVALDNPLISLGLKRARQKILHYYPIHDEEIEPIKDLYLATMLDPHMKLNTLKKIGTKDSALSAAEDYFRQVFHRYKKELEEEGSSSKKQRREKKSESKNPTSASVSFFYDVSQTGDDDDHDGESELRRYFSEENAKLSEDVDEYYRRQKAAFPTIFRMAKDYLSMMAMSSPSESLFSRVKNIVTDTRNRLQPHTIKMLAVLKARGIIKDEESVFFDSPPSSNETKIQMHDHAKPLDTNPEQHPSGVGESQSKDIVNLQDVGDGRKRKRFEARIERRLSTTSETECIDNSNLQNPAGLEDLSVRHTQRSEEKSEAKSLDTTHILPDSSDADSSDADSSDAETLVPKHHAESSDAESDDAETLDARHSLELIQLGNNDSTLKEVPKFDGDSGSISDSSEDEEND
ncbi:hypothetical protein OXX80_006107 [Metschnikowia pulcherrima]